MNDHQSKQTIARIAIVIAISFLTSLAIFAQNGSWAGKYEGTAKGPNGDVVLKLELTEEGGKYSGQVTSPNGVYKIVNAKMADGVLKFDAEGKSTGKMTLRQKGDALAGDFTADGQTGPVEFKKAAQVDEVSGEWDAVADAQGQPFPFTLSLKLDGDKVTGSSDSQLGHGTITTGTFKEGKLAIVLDGNITLVANMVDGKLSGDYDFAGQSSGKWVAVKKK